MSFAVHRPRLRTIGNQFRLGRGEAVGAKSDLILPYIPCLYSFCFLFLLVCAVVVVYMLGFVVWQAFEHTVMNCRLSKTFLYCQEDGYIGIAMGSFHSWFFKIAA